MLELEPRQIGIDFGLMLRLGQELLRALDVFGLDLEVVGYPQRVGNRQLHSPRLVELRRGVNIERLESSVMN
jgi:hypothetical protein